MDSKNAHEIVTFFLNNLALQHIYEKHDVLLYDIINFII